MAKKLESKMKNRKANRLKGYDYSMNNLYFVTSCVKNMVCCFGDVVLVGTGRDLSVPIPDINNPDINDSKIHNKDINFDENESEMIVNESDEMILNKSEMILNESDEMILNKSEMILNESEMILNESEMILNEYGIIANNQLEWLEMQYPYIVLHAYIVMPNHIHAVIEIDSFKVNPIHKDNIVQLDSANIKIKSLSQIMGAFKTTSSKLIHLANYEEFAWHRSFHDHIIRDEKSYHNIVNYIENNPNNWNKDKFYKK